MVVVIIKKLFLGVMTLGAFSLLLYWATTITSFIRDNGQGMNISWNYLPCDWNVDEIPRPVRHRIVLQCTSLSALISYEEVPFNTTPTVTSLPSHDPCLARLVSSSWCNDAGRRVPRVVHYVWFSPRQMALYTFVSVLSAVRYVKPCLVLFHGDALPQGRYWRALLQLVPNIVHVTCDRPRQIFGHVINVVEHSADVTRLQVLIEYGGIYLDSDQLVLASLDNSRNFSVVLGTETPGQSICNAMIVSEREAEFLRLWLAEYVTFDDSQWGHHSTRVPRLLSEKRPDLVHIVDSFFRPYWGEIGKYYTTGEHHSWDDILALHLYARDYKDFFSNEELLVQENCTIGELLRHVLHGASDACLTRTVVNKTDITYKQDGRK